LLFIFKF